MNPITSYLRNLTAAWFMPDELSTQYRELLELYATNRAYAEGQQPRQIKVKPNQADDNLVINWIELVLERSISMLFGKDITFDLPGEGDTPASDYLNTIWDANKKNILLHRVGEFGGRYGTSYIKIVPNGITGDNGDTHRLIALNPGWVEIKTNPEDSEKVEQYIIRFNLKDENGKEVARKEITRRIYATEIKPDGNIYQTQYTNSWQVENYIASRETGGKWQELGAPVTWAYEFPPIHHWQNLPNAESCYGKSDLGGILEPQDRYNFIQSNNSRIIRYHAHPKTWGRGISSTSQASWGPDEMILATGETAMIANLEMSSDLASSRQLAEDIRQAIMTLSRTIDISSLKDQAGQLTNFGLKILSWDALSKNDTKRLLYGDGLSEVNRRLLILGGFPPDTGEIQWPEPLPINSVEQSQALTQDLTNGLVSKQTASTRRGYNWAEEEERLATQQSSTDNIGAFILNNFNRGGVG